MKIAIIGVGAMGSVYAALLADQGKHDVWAIDTWKEHVDAIREKGLRVEGASGDRTVRMNATTNPADVKDADLVIVATKYDGVGAAAKAALQIGKPDAPILAIQNGLGSADIVADVVGSKRIMLGVVGGFGASMKGPGHAHHNGMEFLRLGEMDGGMTPRLETVAEAWRKGGFKVLTFDDIHKMVWEKLICNCTYSGPCALTGLRVGEVQSNPSALSIAAACAHEAYQVARAKGITLDFDDPVRYVREFGQKIPGARPSMLLDHLAGRRAEVDNINGAIPREGAKVGIATPVNSVVVALLKAKESGFK
ncbi:2-dehydropantoate 2-reductase [Hyphomicrobium sp. CS1BSMeth3]|uniref:ketopantoate reductase family protein n=1 Tax=Hyphomicrobium sp. CS1BSMeth3 TaxID=1892844 RepID=UPI0009309A9B|nr:2-dehydropantoate 2-reductase [Hyphomicrobium sp. CS1BSMeth3]